MKRLLLTVLVFLAATWVIEAQEPEYDEFVFLPLITRDWPPTTLSVIGEQTTWVVDWPPPWPMNDAFVIGEVYNGTPEYCFFITIPADVFDSSGRLIDTTTSSHAAMDLYPGDKTCFDLRIDNNLDWDYYVLREPQYWSYDKERIGNLVIHDDYGEYLYNGGLREYKILGWVRNDNPFGVTLTDMAASLYNASGTLVGCLSYASITIKDLEPGQESSFEFNATEMIYGDWNGEDIAYYRLQIDAYR